MLLRFSGAEGDTTMEKFQNYTKEESKVKSRTEDLKQKATGFAIAYSYAGKDNKFVTKLTNLGGVLDRKNKEVRFDFKSAAARTKFRKTNKDILKSITEVVELGEESPKIRYAKIMKGIRDSQGPFAVVAIKNGKIIAV